MHYICGNISPDIKIHTFFLLTKNFFGSNTIGKKISIPNVFLVEISHVFQIHKEHFHIRSVNQNRCIAFYLYRNTRKLDRINLCIIFSTSINEPIHALALHVHNSGKLWRQRRGKTRRRKSAFPRKKNNTSHDRTD